jgi:hypothetical protein
MKTDNTLDSVSELKTILMQVILNVGVMKILSN